jgi:hypothetical protein
LHHCSEQQLWPSLDIHVGSGHLCQ